jgi:hypothetical protein
MAGSFASTPFPPSVAALPFLFARPQVDDSDWNFRTAFSAALAAERADQDSRRNTRGRVAYLLCELGYQLARRRIDRDGELSLSRLEIANALGVSLCRVKRTLALLSLSQVIVSDAQRIRVLDWQRLCGVAAFDRSRLELKDEDYEGALITSGESDQPSHQLTASGEPACFV